MLRYAAENPPGRSSTIVFAPWFAHFTGGMTPGEARQVAEELSDLYHNVPFGYHSLDAKGVVIEINDRELGWLGYTRDEVVGKMRLPDLMVQEHSFWFEQKFALLQERGCLHDLEYEMRRKDGSTFPVLVSVTTTRDSTGNFLRTRASVFDISDRKRAQDESRQYAEGLRAISRRMVEVQEAERRAVADELHNLIGQKLAALNINLNIVKVESARFMTPQLGVRLEDSLKLVEETVESIRDVMAELRPAVLDDYGLMPVLRWYAEQFTTRTGLPMTVVEQGTSGRLERATEEALFRITQEALANVVQCARARTVTVTLSTMPGITRLVVADDGSGFDVSAHAEPGKDHGWGLMIMRERAAAVGAELNVESAPGMGTRIVVTLSSRLPGRHDNRYAGC
jgi:PAS domain S-box-containing protein